RFATQSRCFMDAYHKGLDGKQAAWAAKKYRGHCVLPVTLMDDLDHAKLIRHHFLFLLYIHFLYLVQLLIQYCGYCLPSIPSSLFDQ
ncbi:hypothetical protein PAXRUDRAFT_152039, partial [Paxillus rubicundulus Ve08.2h10]